MYEIPTAIPGFDGFYITKSGKVYSKWQSGRPIELGPIWELRECILNIDENGYYNLKIRKTGELKHTHKGVHNLLLMTFVRLPEKGEVTRHLDGNPLNNNLSNLCWGTYLENAQDKEKHGNKLLGETMGTAKLTIEQVLEIKKKYNGRNTRGKKIGPTFKQLGREYGVYYTCIMKIIHGVSWVEAIKQHEENLTALPYLTI